MQKEKIDELRDLFLKNIELQQQMLDDAKKEFDNFWKFGISKVQQQMDANAQDMLERLDKLEAEYKNEVVKEESIEPIVEPNVVVESVAQIEVEDVKAESIKAEDIKVDEIEVEDIKAEDNTEPISEIVEATPQPKEQPLQAVVRDEEKSLEQKIGKNLMGIAASVLIFISLIFFASVVTPTLSEGARVALMFVVSAAFTGGGFFFLQKKSFKQILPVVGKLWRRDDLSLCASHA